MIKSFLSYEDIIDGVLIAQENYLYLIGGRMLDWYKEVWTIKALYIYYLEGEPVGAFCVRNRDEPDCRCNCGIFVLKRHRRRGIGRKLIEKSRKDGIEYKPWKLEPVAKKFYETV